MGHTVLMVSDDRKLLLIWSLELKVVVVKDSGGGGGKR